MIISTDCGLSSNSPPTGSSHRDPHAEVGYSDHTAGTAVPLAAVARGANIIEKHITLDRDVPNAQDWKVFCDPTNFAQFVRDIREIEAALDSGPKHIGHTEREARLWACKSLTAVVDIPAGTQIAASMIRAQRPGTGLPPFKAPEVIGRRATSELSAGTVLTDDLLD